jgi:glycosyltransferase involved in cell wall biosynthesis
MPRFLRYLVESRAITHVWISNSTLGYELLPFLRAHCPHVAYLDFVHAEQPQRHGGFARLAADHDQLLDLHLATSQHLRQYMAGLGADPARTEVCYIGADTGRWRPDQVRRAQVRAELGLDAGTPLVLFVGRLSAEKRPLLAAEVLRELRGRGLSFQALFAGDGDDATQLRWFVRRHRLAPQLRLLGGVPHTRVGELMAAADVLLLPSEREGIAVTLFEAMATGVVPVAADVGGQRELLTPQTGILVAAGPHEHQEYVAALQRLIERPEERSHMALAARARIERCFDATHLPGRVRDLLDQAAVLAQAAARSPVPASVGLAAATLAIEHQQLERRLRRLAPVRVALAIRWTRLGRTLAQLGSLRSLSVRFDRVLYSTRRTIGQMLRRMLRRV